MLSLFKKIENDFNGVKNAFDNYMNKMDAETDIQQLRANEEKKMQELCDGIMKEALSAGLPADKKDAIEKEILQAMKESGSNCFEDGFNAGYIDGSENAGMEYSE